MQVYVSVVVKVRFEILVRQREIQNSESILLELLELWIKKCLIRLLQDSQFYKIYLTFIIQNRAEVVEHIK